MRRKKLSRMTQELQEEGCKVAFEVPAKILKQKLPPGLGVGQA